MESNQPLDSNFGGDLNLSTNNRFDLKEAATWAKFLAIIGFIFIGLGVIGMFSISAIMATAPIDGMAGMSSLVIIFYIIGLLIYFLPILYLFRFATKIKSAINTGRQMDMDTAFSNLKAHYKFLGILTAIVLGIYFIIFLVAISTGLSGF